MDGILLIDKPAGPTSHDVVAQARRILEEPKIGHAGTLDPPATGLLILALGKALKLLEFMEGHDKEYEFTVRFGRTTDTDDATGRTLEERDASALTREAVESALHRFRGEIDQRAPRVSALKVAGRRLHESARRGESVEVPVRRVHIHNLELRNWNPPLVSFTVTCSKGTYVRAIARDLGEAVGTGGCVESLRRLSSGPFHVRDAVTLDRPRAELETALLPPDVAVHHLPESRLSTEEALAFTRGKTITRSAPPGPLRIYVGPRFLGIADSDGSALRPRKVLG